MAGEGAPVGARGMVIQGIIHFMGDVITEGRGVTHISISPHGRGWLYAWEMLGFLVVPEGREIEGETIEYWLEGNPAGVWFDE